MKLEDFKIGETFFASAGFEWLCTDKGTRTITAIMLEPEKEQYWFVGPPYAIDEVVFDEHKIKSCYLSGKDMLLDRIGNLEESSHPNFDHKDVLKMSKELKNRQKYHRKSVMKRDRVGKGGEILHPYSAVRKDDGWYIKTFELFSREYSEMHENDFVQLLLSDEQAMKVRKENFS
jgi:hypothetical protein